MIRISSIMALPQLDESKMKLVQELEIEMMTDMYARYEVENFLMAEVLFHLAAMLPPF